MEASRECSCSPPRMASCSEVSVFQRTSMSQVLDTHHMCPTLPTIVGSSAVRGFLESGCIYILSVALYGAYQEILLMS